MQKLCRWSLAISETWLFHSLRRALEMDARWKRSSTEWIGERRRPTAGRLGSLAVALFGSVALEALSLRSRALACCSRTTSLLICDRQCVRFAQSGTWQPASYESGGGLYRPPIHQVCLSSSPAQGGMLSRFSGFETLELSDEPHVLLLVWKPLESFPRLVTSYLCLLCYRWRFS